MLHVQTNPFVGVIRPIDTGREVSNPGLWEDLWGVGKKQHGLLSLFSVLTFACLFTHHWYPVEQNSVPTAAGEAHTKLGTLFQLH